MHAFSVMVWSICIPSILELQLDKTHINSKISRVRSSDYNDGVGIIERAIET